MPGAKVVDGDHYTQRVQLFEQLVGHVRRLDQFAFRQLQHQTDTALGERAEKFTAILYQLQVMTMAGGDVDANMKKAMEKSRSWREDGSCLFHQQIGRAHV